MQTKKYFFSFFKLFFIISIVILFDRKAESALTSVTLSGLPSLNNMSDGRGYFLASGTDAAKEYNFDISVINPGAAGAASYDYFRITIPTQTGNIVVNWNSDGAGADVTGVTPVGAGSLVGGTGALISGLWSNGVVRLTVRFYWPAEAANNGNRIITAQASDGTTTLSDTKNLTYGICSNIRVFSFINNAPLILPDSRAANFTVTGTLIYDIPGYTTETSSDAVANADITSVELELRNRDNNNSALPPGTFILFGTNNLSYTIPQAQSIPARAQGYYWQVQAAFSGGAGANEYSPADNRVSLESNYVRVTNIEFIGGNGRGPTHSAPNNISTYYRRYGDAGTQVRLTARMHLDSGSGIAMHGNTTFKIEYTDGTNTGDFTVTINNGSTVGAANIEFDNASGFLTAWLAANTTKLWTYRVTDSLSVQSVYGGNYGIQLTGDGNGDYGNGLPVVTQTIRWDRDDPPGSGQPTVMNILPGATSLALYWSPVATITTDPGGPYEEDFYEYRVYFKEKNDTGPYKIWNGESDTTLRGLTNNPSAIPVSDTSKHFDGNGWKYTTIPNLKIFTDYYFYITTVDVFGNETAAAAPTTIKTKPYSIDISLSDGVTSYTNDSFNNLTPGVRPLLETNIKVDITIITSDTLPDMVKVWYTTGDITAAPDIVNTAANSINTGAFATNTLFSSEAKKTAANKWTAYLQTTSGIIKTGYSIRFIVESSLNNISSFSDHIPDDPNGDEWTFFVAKKPEFQPWPVRILNNVITNKNPTAYPSYYLSDDAHVTIIVYDVKGRPVVTILDNAFRRGGENIKEQGWSGINKGRKKLGVGLYYMHFTAKSARTGKVILNKFRKVVIAR